MLAEPVGAERVKLRSESAADGVAALIVTVRVPALVIWVGSAPAELFGAELIDWNAISSGHPEYFAPDGVHLVPAGVRAYVDSISSKL